MRLQMEHTFAEKLEGLYVAVEPEGFPAPRLLQWNEALHESLGLPKMSEDELAAFFSGTKVPDDAKPLAQAYAGHQFGGFSPQLGDGRAMLIGEIIDRQGERFDLQLKGSGPTPFSRGGDGRASVGPILREYLVSDAMFHLGVRTSRVLAAVQTGEQVRRDKVLPGAVLARIAASHLRIGTLQFFAVREDQSKLERLVAYALERHYPDRVSDENKALSLLEEVAMAQAKLIAHWMQVGFVHGVMNTDNMTLSGETIDYGPCAFLDTYDPGAVFSSIDQRGRYAYGKQAPIGMWNLTRMGEALIPLLSDDEEIAVEQVQGVLELYLKTFQTSFHEGMLRKIGLAQEGEEDETLVMDLFDWMAKTKQDFTRTFRRLATGLREGTQPFADDAFAGWHARWLARLGDEDLGEVAARMDLVNPIYIPRNHLVEEALNAAIAGDLGPFEKLNRVLASPFTPQPGYERYEEPAPPDFGPYRTFCGT